MGAFSGLKEARSTQGGLYLKPGNYTVQVQKVKMQKSQVGNREFFIAELKVVDSDNEEMKANSEPSWLVELPGKYPELALGNVKAFLHAAFSSMAEAEGEEAPDEEDIDEAMATLAVSEDNPLAGVFMSAKAFQKETKSGGEFTRVKWGVPSDIEELAASA